METSDNRRQDEKRTPIIDGDARPDIDVNAQEKSDRPKKAEKKKTTKNRNDINSLEDFRDAKQE